MFLVEKKNSGSFIVRNSWPTGPDAPSTTPEQQPQWVYSRNKEGKSANSP